MEGPLHYVLISPLIHSFMVENGRENREKMVSAAQYLTRLPLLMGMLQPEPCLSALKTATNQLA